MLGLVTPEDVESFRKAWLLADPTREGAIIPQLLPKIIRALAPPLGTSGQNTREALHLSLRLRLAPTNRGTLRYEDVLESLAWRDVYSRTGTLVKPREGLVPECVTLRAHLQNEGEILDERAQQLSNDFAFALLRQIRQERKEAPKYGFRAIIDAGQAGLTASRPIDVSEVGE